MSQTKTPIVILIVEDQDLMRGLLREFVHAAYRDATILQAADGAQALELCAGGAPHLVLMDVGLPDANGIDVTARIKQLLPQTTVIMVSQHTAEVYVERARAAGAYGYVRKDRVYRELLPMIHRALTAEPRVNRGEGES